MGAIAQQLSQFRPGPDDMDPLLWQDVPAARRQMLLLNGEENDRMRAYRNQMAEIPKEQRSTMEQMYLWMAAQRSVPERAVLCDPAPVQAPPYKLLGLAVILFIALVFMFLAYSRARAWKPFSGCPPCAAVR